MKNITKKECPFLAEGTMTCSLKVSIKGRSVGGSWDYSGGVASSSGSTVYESFYGPCKDDNNCPINYIVNVVRMKLTEENLTSQ